MTWEPKSSKGDTWLFRWRSEQSVPQLSRPGLLRASLQAEGLTMGFQPLLISYPGVSLVHYAPSLALSLPFQEESSRLGT